VDLKTVEHDARGVSATTTVDVRFGSKADISLGPADVRLTPNSGHRKRPRYQLRRTNSGSLAIFTAIRRASSFVSNLALFGVTGGTALAAI
jgi:hypothetical protein